MMDHQQWQEANNRYLSAALAWLRLLLQRQAYTLTRQPQPRRLLGWRRPNRGQGPSAAEVERAARAMAEAEAINPLPALIALGESFALSRVERDLLLLCVAMELDTGMASLCAGAQPDMQRPYPTFALALGLFDKPAWDILSPERPLRYWRLIEINQPGGSPLTCSALRADERVVNYIKGLDYLDDRLTPLLVPFDVTDSVQTGLPVSQQEAVQHIVQYVNQSKVSGVSPVVQLVGPDTLSKQLVAIHAVRQLGAQIFRLPAAWLPAQAAELETLARLWQREVALSRLALYLDTREGSDIPGAAEAQAPALHRLLSRDLGLVFLDVREVQPGLGRYSLPFDIDKPAPAEQQETWRTTLSEQAPASPAQLAGQFSLNLPTIQQITRSALAEGPLTPPQVHERAWQACLLRTRPRLDQLAQRLEPKVAWADLVLPDPEIKLLRQIAGQVAQRSTVYDDWGFRDKMNRGLGISVLFHGESGTGQTMGAEVIAGELRLNLYRIDLSAVVSKYIGETEKNLRRLFDAAEDGGVILFFDEADALFGKRSEVKDSHDRYANIEINYLLQRMEGYAGLAILATNMKSALDQAFLRRLRFIVDFPLPGQPERKRIWERVFPAATRTDVLDYDWLARFNLTGGSIHNIALNAAFLAASAGTVVTMPLLLEAARVELRKLGRPINDADLRWPH